MAAPGAEEPEFVRLVDARGLRCPEPVMLLHNAIRKAAAGEVLKLVATDPSTRRDVSRFCNYLGHKLLVETVREEEFCYFIRRGG
ncbi:MAG: sulfurtransferase TusA [Pseudomonadota bacterium]|jgi:tRNA 2-thiouridine synthesizing protein A